MVGLAGEQRSGVLRRQGARGRDLVRRIAPRQVGVGDQAAGTTSSPPTSIGATVATSTCLARSHRWTTP